MVRDHQSGEAVFRSILPEDIEWKSCPAFPPSAQLAVLVAEPNQAAFGRVTDIPRTSRAGSIPSRAPTPARCRSTSRCGFGREMIDLLAAAGLPTS